MTNTCFMCFLILVVVFSSSKETNVVKYAAIGDGLSLILTKDVIPSLGKVKKHDNNPLFGQDKVWEARIDNGYANVIYDPDHEHPFRLWYDSFIINTESNGSNDRLEAWLYAYSHDGIKWTKPNMGMYEFQGSKDNNILFEAAGLGIYDDIKNEKNISRRYKGFGQFNYAKADGVGDSPDGFTWNNIQPLHINNRWDTHNNLFYDERTKRYVGTTRGPHDPFPHTVIRTIARTVSGIDMYKSFSQAVVVEKELVKDQQPYTQITFPFHNIYLGLVMIFHNSTEDQTVHCELAWSPDTIKWNRILPETEFIPRSPKPLYDSWIIFAARPIFVPGEEKIRIYYFGGDGPHYGKRKSYFSLAMLRPDGYVGVKPSSKNTSVIVKSVTLECIGKKLIVTADVEKGGSIKVSVEDGGKEFSFENCNGVERTSTDHEVTWKGGLNLSRFVGKQIILQFQFTDSVLFTFGFETEIE